MSLHGVFSLMLLILPLKLMAQEKDLTSLSLAELFNVEVVSVTKNRGRLLRAPAAVHVITQDDIRRSGATSFPEALRLAPGIHVARVNGSQWAIGMRGFNNLSSNKLLVMLDGRTIYNPIMSGVLWNQQMIMLEDIERIEVIRGPAGSVWGANAVNGVINVVSKQVKTTQGVLFAASGGGMDPARASLRYGGKLGPTAAWRTWIHHEVNGQGRARQPQPPLGVWNTSRVGMRLDWQPGARDELEVQGELTFLNQDLNFFNYVQPSAPAVIQGPGDGQAGFMLGKWTHTNRRGDQSKLQLFEDIQNMNLGAFRLSVRTFDVDFQHAIQLRPKHSLLLGGGFRMNTVETVGTVNLSFQPPDRTYLVSNAFAQHEWQIVPDRLALTLGARVERYTLAGSTFQPSVRLMWAPTSRQAYWTSASGAVRTPAHYDYSLRYPVSSLSGVALPVLLQFTGSETIRPETLRGFEVGARWQVSRKTVVEAAAYHNSYARLNDTYQAPFPLNPSAFAGGATSPAGSAIPTIPLILVNGRDATTRGGEIVAHYDVHRRLRVTASYSATFFSAHLRPGLDPASIVVVGTYYPKHMAQARASWDLSSRWLFDAEVFRTASLTSDGLPVVAGFTRVDFRLERKLSERLAISVNGKNLLRPWQKEFVGVALYPGANIGRSFTVGLRWEH